jgi:hypothetical protein
MPLIKIDYNESILPHEQMQDLVQSLLKESMRIYEYNEDKVSIFTAPFGQHHFSTAAAEIEVRAKIAEYEKPAITKNELRKKHLAEYKLFLQKFISQNNLPKGIVFTITFEDWQVEWLPPSS